MLKLVLCALTLTTLAFADTTLWEQDLTNSLLRDGVSSQLHKMAISSWNGIEIRSGVFFDALGNASHFDGSYTALWIGTRLENLPQSEFTSRLTKHVHAARNAFSEAIRGYLFYATNDYEIAYLNFSSEEEANKAFGSPAGKAVNADAASFMKPVLFLKLERKPWWLRSR